MKKTEWYKNRILWRAGKLHLEDYAWSNFVLSKKQCAKEILEATAGHGAPLYVFFLNDYVWTVLTDKYLVGRLDEVLSSVSLDELGEVVTVNNKSLPPNELKIHANIIRAGRDKSEFWTPAGNAHFSLRNILGMFPLNVP